MWENSNQLILINFRVGFHSHATSEVVKFESNMKESLSSSHAGVICTAIVYHLGNILCIQSQ